MGSGRAGCRGTCRTLCPAPPSGLGAPPPPLSRGTVCGVHLCALGADMEPAPRRYQCMSLALEQKPGAGVDVPEGAQQGSLGARGVCRGDPGPWSQGRANGRGGGQGWGEETWGLLCAGGISTMCSVALARTCRLLCSGLGRGILWRARAGHAANEERKSDVEPQLPRLRAGTAAAGRGAHGAGLPSSPHPDGAAASIRPREPWARGSDCAGTDPRQHPGRAPRELPSPSKPTQTGQRIVAWDVA